MTEVNWYIKGFFFLAGGFVATVVWVLVGLAAIAVSPTPL